MEMDGINPELCPLAGFDISGVKPSGFSSTASNLLHGHLNSDKWMNSGWHTFYSNWYKTNLEQFWLQITDEQFSDFLITVIAVIVTCG
jgi:hypothetical protein